MDMFPQTTKQRKRLWIYSLARKNSEDIQPIVSSHVETVVVLGRQRIDSHISFDLDVKKLGISERKNYNVGSGKRPMPLCPPEKEEAIKDALRHFGLI